jgi:hypothetical protein
MMHAGTLHASGRYGRPDPDLIADRLEMQAPFQAEALAL